MTLLDVAAVATVGRALLDAYSEEWRHYHDVRHIAAMLDEIDERADRFENPEAARLAAFFHDAVYRPGRTDNERESAERLLGTRPFEIGDDVTGPACKMILATSEHRATGDADADLFIDVDMAILAASWPEYARYATDVMREFAPVVGEKAYREGRVGLFLAPMLERGVVFLTQGYASRNAEALRNMERERAILASGGEFDVRG